MGVTIRNFDTMREEGGMYFLQNFEPKKIGDKSVLSQHFSAFVQDSSGSEANLGLVSGFTYSSDIVYNSFLVTDNGYIFHSFTGNPTEHHQISSTSSEISNYPDIHATADDWLYYTSARYVGKYDGSTWTDKWLDLGSSYDDANAYRQIANFEDRYLIGNKSYLASVTNTSSDFQNEYKQLINGYEFKAMAVNNQVAVAANNNYRGAIMFWDGYSDGWNEILFLEDKVDTIKPFKSGWVFVSGASLKYTNGHTIQEMDKFPDENEGEDLTLHPNGIAIAGDKIYIAKNAGFLSRDAMGVWIYDVTKKGWIFVPTTKGSWYKTGGSEMGAIYKSSRYNSIYTGYRTRGGTYFLDSISDGANPEKGSCIFPVYNLQKGDETTIKRIEVDFMQNQEYHNEFDDRECNMYLAVSDLKRPLWGYGVTNTASSNANELKIDRTASGYNQPQVGDEVLVLERSNVGERAYVTDVTGTSSATVTLDRNLSNNTENETEISVMPFKLADGKTKYTEGGTATFYPKFKGSQMLLKIWLDNTHFPISITEIRIYD